MHVRGSCLSQHARDFDLCNPQAEDLSGSFHTTFVWLILLSGALVVLVVLRKRGHVKKSRVKRDGTPRYPRWYGIIRVALAVLVAFVGIVFFVDAIEVLAA